MVGLFHNADTLFSFQDGDCHGCHYDSDQALSSFPVRANRSDIEQVIVVSVYSTDIANKSPTVRMPQRI
jgi:hypothetical protein